MPERRLETAPRYRSGSSLVRVRAALQAEVLGLLGLVVEAATFIVIEERAGEDRLVVDVVTGVLDHQSPFKAHGHTIRFRVTTAR